MIMAILGGDDAGGGVIWAPQVITDATDHGLVLGENGKLYDTKKGQSLPEGVKPMPLLTDEELKAFPEPTALDVVPGYVARYWDLMALAGKSARQGHRRRRDPQGPPRLRGRAPHPRLDPRGRPTPPTATRC